jgi:SAM-dependent methyltransferase
MTTVAFDQAVSDAFAEQLLTMLNHGALTLMISIGHRTGLFDTMSTLPPVTSNELAAAAGLHERYVREWLGALTVGGIVQYDPTTATYTLPAEHAAWLTRAATPNNIAVFAQYIPLLGEVEEGILAKFRTGGGLHYHDYPRFHAIMAEDSAQTVVAALREHILPLVNGLEARLTAGIDVLDLGCGKGLALLEMAQMFPQSRFTGYELNTAVTAETAARAAALGLHNLRFAAQDAALLAETASYDLICTFDAIHDQADPLRVLTNIRRALRPDGVYLMQDIRASSALENNLDHPIGPLLYTISTMHCTSVSLAVGGAGLGTMWGEELALDLLARAGFSRVRIEQPAHDFQNNYYVAKH